MRISDWSSDVCSSDLFMLEQIEHDRNSLIVGYLIGIIGNKAFEVRRYPPLTDPFGDRGPFGPQFTARVEIGRASCRERVCQYVKISVVAVSLKKKQKYTIKMIYHRYNKTKKKN